MERQQEKEYIRTKKLIHFAFRRSFEIWQVPEDAREIILHSIVIERLFKKSKLLRRPPRKKKEVNRLSESTPNLAATCFKGELIELSPVEGFV